MGSFEPSNLPLSQEEELETRQVLKKLAVAHRHLAELKGVVRSIPNESILISTLTLQEAKDSSEVENIVTTHDELFKNGLSATAYNPAAKEVKSYARALNCGFETVRRTELLRLQDILDIQQTLEENRAGLRKLPGTELKNMQTGEVVYTPPQSPDQVESLMSNLVAYINDHGLSDNDPLVKMAVIHFQFESIHPFYDGNGRTGRIINILYLVAQKLLDLPVLYLSRYIIRNKAEYYRHLQGVRDSSDWEGWLLFMLQAVEETSKETTRLIEQIKTMMQTVKHRMRHDLPKIYSQDLLNNLFCHPYTKIEFVEKDLGVSRLTATKYLEQLCEKGFLVKQKMGRSNYYINEALVKLFLDIGRS
ncbi:Fic family protein [Sansalvadorimonas verongulae]|uniref:Fic family protein n=1 Tax=Sansalvadorimonas verongulae TaxID=2172824 RepID=UPI0012BB586B|nr:Fic family protein [Sansalvadorimonas verongulae]MTI12335.1 Fic family protein [Sansalvadorimonas verongulae]